MLLRVKLIVAVAVLASAAVLSRDALLKSALFGPTTAPKVERRIPDELRKLIANQDWRPAMPSADRSALAVFYRSRDYAPLWYVDGAITSRARAAIESLTGADAEGLRSADYNVSLVEAGADARNLADAEYRLTGAVLIYMRHLQHGRFAYARVSRDIFYKSRAFDRADALARIAANRDVVETLALFRPPQPAYLALKAQLNKLRAAPATDEQQQKIDAVIVNMERWRWMPHDLGINYVIVNIPDFSLIVVRDGAAAFATRVVVGDVTWPTPILSADMTSITLNPIWNVPQSIVDKDYATAFAEDPDRLERLGLRVFRRADGSLQVYQLPGEMNALGQIRFNFPNKFSVYQHDTPDKYLFGRQSRTFSHGCMRVEKPFDYAQTLLGIVAPEKDYNAQRIYGLIGGDEINIDFPHAIPVHLTYQTAFLNERGSLQLREDIYGLDKRMLAELAREPGKLGAEKSAKRAAARSAWQRLRHLPRAIAIRLGHWWEKFGARRARQENPNVFNVAESSRLRIVVDRGATWPISMGPGCANKGSAEIVACAGG